MKHLSKTILALCFISLLAEQSKASVRQNSLLRVENRTEQSSTFDQSPSISQFTDVQPTDLSYSALKNLVEIMVVLRDYLMVLLKVDKPLDVTKKSN